MESSHCTQDIFFNSNPHFIVPSQILETTDKTKIENLEVLCDYMKERCTSYEIDGDVIKCGNCLMQYDILCRDK